MSDEQNDATEKIQQLKGVTWEWREEAPDEAKEQPGLGVIAQDVEKVFPELVETDDQGRKRVEYSGLIAPLIEAVKGSTTGCGRSKRSSGATDRAHRGRSVASVTFQESRRRTTAAPLRRSVPRMRRRVTSQMRRVHGYLGGRMRHLVVLAVLLGAGLLATGFGAAAPAGEPFTPGAVVVGGAGLRVYTPAGAVTDVLAVGTGPRAIQLHAAAAGPPGRIYAATDTPVLKVFDSDGAHGGIGEYPDGFVVTALDSDAAHVYIAVSDGGLLHSIYRSTHAGVHEFPFMVESRVTALDIASDDCSLFYATATRGIRRLDVCSRGASRLVSDLVARDIALLPDSTMLVVPRTGRAILRLAPDGHVLRRYQTPRVKSWRSIAVAPGAVSLWAATPGGVVYRFSLSSGKLEGRRFSTISPLVAVDVIDGPDGTAPPLGPPKQEGSLELDGVETLTGEGLVDIADGRPTAPQQCTAPNPATMEFSPPAGSLTAAVAVSGEFSSTLTDRSADRRSSAPPASSA